MKTKLIQRHGLLTLLALLALAGCSSSKPGTSDIEAGLAAVYDCPILEVRDVKKLNGEPGPQGTYQVAVTYTVAFKGGESGAAKLLTDWVALRRDDLAAINAQIAMERESADDPRLPALKAYGEQTSAALSKLVPCGGKEFEAVVMPLYRQAEEAMKAGAGVAALPIGVQLVRPGVMGHSENGWYFRQLAPGFNSFEVLESRPVVFSVRPSKLPVAASGTP